jgi:hypothetical protein
MDEVPDTYVSTGAYNTDTLIFVLSDSSNERQSCSAQTLAYASHCQLDQYDRPVFGYIQMCAERSFPKPRESQRDEDLHTALHEITHILGFSEMLFPFFRHSNLQPRTPRCPSSSAGARTGAMPEESSVNGQKFLWYQGSGQVGWCCAINTLGQPPFRCEADEFMYLIRSWLHCCPTGRVRARQVRWLY